MTSHRILVLLTLLGSLSSCQEDQTPIFDGSGDLVLSYQTSGGNPGYDQAYLGKNGYSFLFIRDDGHYWAFGATGKSEWSDVKEGVISEEEGDKYLNQVGYHSWTPTSGYKREGLFDAGGVTLRSSSAKFTVSGCMDQGIQGCEFSRKTRELLDNLWEKGKPVTGALALKLMEGQKPATQTEIPDWPLERSISEFVVPYEEYPNSDGIRVSGSDAETLRDLRRAVTINSLGVLTLMSSGQYYWAYPRDRIEIEDENGDVALRGLAN